MGKFKEESMLLIVHSFRRRRKNVFGPIHIWWATTTFRPITSLLPSTTLRSVT